MYKSDICDLPDKIYCEIKIQCEKNLCSYKYTKSLCFDVKYDTIEKKHILNYELTELKK